MISRNSEKWKLILSAGIGLLLRVEFNPLREHSGRCANELGIRQLDNFAPSRGFGCTKLAVLSLVHIPHCPLFNVADGGIIPSLQRVSI